MGSLSFPIRFGRRSSLSSIVAFALCFGVCVGAASAIEDAPKWSYAMAHDLMSPYCPGRTLAECPSPQATELRFWILTQAAAGVSQAEVRAMLADRFGDVLLAAPRAEGWGLTAYAIPIAFFVIGGPVVVLIIRRLATGGAAPERAEPGNAPHPAYSDSDSDSDPDLERQLESELGEI